MPLLAMRLVLPFTTRSARRAELLAEFDDKFRAHLTAC
ncbi:hypothetical protein CAMGR0001_0754 [Campylobacter gracilis RM3268]|uniref:Uncharacterized protein n=1 Tax=Campylobacter gracilis RM3268 TaxID=553220 RepID=C8PFW2_9BACT|nr:hypothetical protein CAMGR0001_0754 [Campylobacter gracilis RM3268]